MNILLFDLGRFLSLQNQRLTQRRVKGIDSENHLFISPKRNILSKSLTTYVDLETQRSVFDSVARHNGISSLEQYYVKQNVFKTNPKTQEILANLYKGSLFNAITSIYPDLSFKWWRFKSLDANFWNDLSNQRDWCEWVSSQLSMNDMNEWYTVTIVSLHELGGRAILSQYNSSIYTMISTIYPEIDWKPWMFRQVTPEWWNNKDNQRKYLEWLTNHLGFKNKEDWYKLTSRHLIDNYGTPLKTNICDLLMDLYPEDIWLPWKFSKVPNGFWDDIRNQKRFFDWVGKELGVTHLDEWHNKSALSLQSYHGYSFIKYKYSGSLYNALIAIYPDHNWDKNKFWDTKPKKLPTLKEIEEMLKIQSPLDWYSISKSQRDQVPELTSLIRNKFNGSFISFLAASYPSIDWEPWKLKQEKFPKYFWQDKNNRKKFMDHLAKKFAVNKPDDWYSIKSSLITNEASGLLAYYGNSLVRALTDLYGDQFEFWKFTRTSPQIALEEVEKLADYLTEKLFIKHSMEWERVSKDLLLKMCGQRSFLINNEKLLSKFGQVLARKYNDPKLERFYDGSKSLVSQWRLMKCVQELFPSSNVYENYQFPNLVYPGTNHSIIVDVFVENHKIVLEYQGKHHYISIPMYGDVEEYKKRDFKKKEICEKEGMTFVTIPFWWDLELDSLQSTLHEIVPSLVAKSTVGLPIPMEFNGNKKIT